MEDKINKRLREYEGPPNRLSSQPRAEDELYDPDITDEGLSLASWLTNKYGPKGVGWDFLTDEFSISNQIEKVGTETTDPLAREALKNSGELSPLGHPVVYPNGDNIK